METEGSLPHPKAPATCPYPEPEPSGPYLPIPLLEKSILISYFNLCLSFKSGLFPSDFPIVNPVCTFPVFRTCYITPHLIILDLIARITWCGRKVMRLATLCTNRQFCCLPLHMAVRLTPAVNSVQV